MLNEKEMLSADAAFHRAFGFQLQKVKWRETFAF